MYKICVVFAVFAVANAQYWNGRRTGPAAVVSDVGDQSGYNVQGFHDQGANDHIAGAQGAQGAQGAMEYGNGHQHAAASEQRGRYDHGASLLAANEDTSAAAEMAGGRYDSSYNFQFGEAAEGAQGSEAAAGQFAAAEVVGAHQAAQALRDQEEAKQYALPLPVAYYGGYGAPYRANYGGYGAAGYAGAKVLPAAKPVAQPNYYGGAGAAAGYFGAGAGAVQGQRLNNKVVPVNAAGYYGNRYYAQPPAGVYNYGLRPITNGYYYNKH